MKYILLIIAFGLSLSVFSQEKPVYKLYDKEGSLVSYYTMVDSFKESDVVFFGELHNNAISHWLQYELVESLYEIKSKQLVLAAEMFESDNQLIIDEYLGNLIKQNKFESEVRLWDNYSTDYKPLMEFAKNNNLKFVASNVPRRYASMVSSGGFEALEKLSDEAKIFLPDLPVPYDAEVACYKNMMKMMMGGKGKPNTNFPKAQAIKDATMAYFILKNLNEGDLVLHFNGRYHSDNFEGIIWYLNNYGNALEISTITTEVVEDVSVFPENLKGVADYIILVDENMTTTY